MLPLEFGRISRDGRLTLVINPGSPAVQSYWALCDADALPTARENLRLREGCNVGSIRSVIAKSHSDHKMPEIEAAVYEWLQSQAELDAAVWTGLSSNWLEKRRRSLAEEDAVLYLQEIASLGVVYEPASSVG